MSNSNKIRLTSGSLEPFAPISHAVQLPISLFEALHLATVIDKALKSEHSGQLKAILNSYIDVVLGDSTAIMKVENMALNGYKIHFEKVAEFDNAEIDDKS
jgi:hypothetical protein